MPSACCAAAATPRVDWIDLRWPVAIYFLAIPATTLVWGVTIAVRFMRPAPPLTQFALIVGGVLASFAAAAVFGVDYLDVRRQRRLSEQLDRGAVESVQEELLVDAEGPIGVTLRYRVVYPLGLDLDEDHGAFAQVATARTRSAFVVTPRRVVPHVSGHHEPGTYEVTERFVPAFMPDAFLSSLSDPSASNRCLRWQPDLDRDTVLTAEVAVLSVNIFVSHSPIVRQTNLRYRLADFHATALGKGAVECPRQWLRDPASPSRPVRMG